MSGQDQKTDSLRQELQQMQRKVFAAMLRVFLAQSKLNLWVYHCLDSNGVICHASCTPILDDNNHAILGLFPCLVFYRTKSHHGLRLELPIERVHILQTTVGRPRDSMQANPSLYLGLLHQVQTKQYEQYPL